MAQRDDPHHYSYPTGRGYGHDYLRGGEVLGGYGYSARPGYERRRGDDADHSEMKDAGRQPSADATATRSRPRHQPDQRSS